MNKNLAIVLEHPRFFQIERRPTRPTKAGAPWGESWQVGVGIREGRVDWWEGSTLEEACDKAAAAIQLAQAKVNP